MYFKKFKINKFFYILIIISLFFSLPSFSGTSKEEFHSFIEKQLGNEKLEPQFKKGLSISIEKGPNFNGGYYGFTYLCGSSHAICGVIFDPYKLEFIFFPFVFYLDDIDVKFSKYTNQICVTGSTSLGEEYNNKCFELVSGNLISKD